MASKNKKKVGKGGVGTYSSGEKEKTIDAGGG